KSISGIRGTIGGSPHQNLTPVDVVECIAGLGIWLKNHKGNQKIVVGRDGRISGNIVSQLAVNTLLSMGIDVVDLGLSTTPTVEMMVPKLKAGAGIIFTASHNPKEWNALKFLNEKGEFISGEDGQEIIDIIDRGELEFSTIDNLGTYTTINEAIAIHISEILKYKHVNQTAIRHAGFQVVVDCINSTGAISVPPLLDALGVEYTLINDRNFGHFAHNPEPLPKHLEQLSGAVISNKADVGISVDPDVDRLAFVCEDGSMFGEEYTLVAIADFILGREKGNSVSNLSSTRALADVTVRHGGRYSASAVGEVHVVNEMKRTGAIIGGEGNGGVIVPDLHYGRDALAAIAIFLSLLAEKGLQMTALKLTYPTYVIIKDKIDLTNDLNLDIIFAGIKQIFKDEKLNDTDGLKIDFDEGWVHMRKSNTEPILRIYAEAKDETTANKLIQKVKANL
ncbi:MAG: phosphoglucosamine mutase, partial [Saprospiraceae bacterium]|nr:phosphoglucosamine mutase [Saprospiraceae bacterium]